MVWFLEKSTLNPDLLNNRILYKRFLLQWKYFILLLWGKVHFYRSEISVSQSKDNSSVLRPFGHRLNTSIRLFLAVQSRLICQPTNFMPLLTRERLPRFPTPSSIPSWRISSSSHLAQTSDCFSRRCARHAPRQVRVTHRTINYGPPPRLELISILRLVQFLGRDDDDECVIHMQTRSRFCSQAFFSTWYCSTVNIANFWHEFFQLHEQIVV